MPMTMAIAERVRAAPKALAMNVKVAIAVVDARGDLWTQVRMDGSRWTTSTVCQGKAFAAATFGRPSGELTANAGSPVIQSVIMQQSRRLIPAQGHTVILERSGQTTFAFICLPLREESLTTVAFRRAAVAARRLRPNDSQALRESI